MRVQLAIALVGGPVLAACGGSSETDRAPSQESSAQPSSATPSALSTVEADVGVTLPPSGRPLREFDVSSLRDIVYLTDIDDVHRQMVMQRFVPDGIGPWPVVILLHGGTMTGADMGPLAVDLAKRGLIVYTPTYLHDLWSVDPAQLESARWVGTTLIGDLACAVRVARADAPGLEGDPERLLLAGYSMGAAFGATMTLVGDDERLAGQTSGTCVQMEGSAIPSAFFGWEGPYVWREVAESEFPELLGLAPDQTLGLGPLPHVGSPSANLETPFHLRSGDQMFRGHVNAEHMETFAGELMAAGATVTTEVLPGKYHTDLVVFPLLPEMNDLIAEIAYQPDS